MDDRPYGYDDPDELARAWDGPAVSELDFERLSAEPWCPTPGEAFFADECDAA